MLDYGARDLRPLRGLRIGSASDQGPRPPRWTDHGHFIALLHLTVAAMFGVGFNMFTGASKYNMNTNMPTCAGKPDMSFNMSTCYS